MYAVNTGGLAASPPPSARSGRQHLKLWPRLRLKWPGNLDFSPHFHVFHCCCLRTLHDLALAPSSSLRRPSSLAQVPILPLEFRCPLFVTSLSCLATSPVCLSAQPTEPPSPDTHEHSSYRSEVVIHVYRLPLEPPGTSLLLGSVRSYTSHHVRVSTRVYKPLST